MSNKNFGEPWQGKIERIRENLREGRYALRDGIFPIVKELIQNAEDAPAKRLLLAWVPGLPRAEHPLLRGPSLLAINNGKFEPANGRAIREMGLSSKAADASTIGKFGLGMKSVFHLAEVFFFVALDGQDRQIDADIRSPWSTDDGGLHADWDDFSAVDQVEITKRVQSLFGHGPWFCLWLPLRTKTNCGGVDPIESQFPGDQPPSELLGPKQFELAASLVPLLAHLKLIQFRICGTDSTVAHDIHVSDQSTRRAALTGTRSIGAVGPKMFAGQVTSKAGSSDSLLVYCGTEHQLDDPHLSALERDENEKWPKRFATDTNTGRSKQVPEKANQHAAVCVTAVERPQAVGQLRIHWAVFLPLGQPDTIELAAGWDVDLFLHGWFFPNSGRTEVEGLSQAAPSFESINDSATVRSAWNHRLARCGTLPLVPGVCAALALRCDWDHGTRINITKSIQRSALFQQFREDVCRREALVRRMTKSGQFEWQIVPANLPVFSLPDTQDELLAAKVFPGLTSIADDKVLVIRSMPRLTAAAVEQGWPPETVRELLATVSARELIKSRTQCDYFLRFLDGSTEDRSPSPFASELVSIVRSALISICGDGTNESRDALQRLLPNIPGHRCIRLYLDIADEQGSELFLALCRSTTSLVWAPSSLLSPDATCDGQLTPSDALAILRELTEYANSKLTAAQADRLGIVAAQVIRATRDFTSLLPVAGDLKLFSGTNCRERKEVPLSWRDIVEHHQRRELFIKPAFLASQLQEALASDSIILISKDLADVLFSDFGNAPAQCRERHILASLTAPSKPALSAPIQRQKLLETMLGYLEGRNEPQFRDSVRYLLHGRADRFSATESLFVTSDSGSSIWWRLARLALTSLDQAWRLIDPIFESIGLPKYRHEFAIETVDAEVAAHLVASATPESFIALRPSPQEYNTLLKHFSVDLLKSLPIHETLDGEFISLSGACYWQGKWSLPPSLQSRVRLLKRSRDEVAWNRQQQLADPLDAHSTIAVVLADAHPATYWRLILDCIEDANSLPEGIRQRLRSTPWVPLPDGTAIKPEDILHLPELKDEVARLVSECPGVFTEPEGIPPDLREHPGFKRLLADIVPPKHEALAMLGVLLLKDPSNCIGNITVSMKDWLNAFHRNAGAPFPRLALLRTVQQRFPQTADKTFEQLCSPIPEARTHAALAFLRETFQAEGSLSRRTAILAVYGKYLRSLVAADRFAESIGELPLPSRGGTWLPASQLCWTNDGVAPEALIASEIEQALSDLFPASPTANVVRVRETHPANSGAKVRVDDATIIKHVRASAERLHQYFHDWRDVIPTEQVGGFLALLGDTPGVSEIAREFLGNRSVEATRERFGIDFDDEHRKQRLIVQVLAEPTMMVQNLLGQPIKVPRNEKPTTLFVAYKRGENPFPEMVITFPLYCIRLNKIDPRHFSEHELSTLLHDSALHLLKELYDGVDPKRFDVTWDDLSQSDQLDIRVTQLRIVDLGFVILDQYGLRKEPHLRRVLDAWDSAHCLKVEREDAPQATASRHGRNAEMELQNSRQELKRLFEEDESTQSGVLQAVRQRIADYYQYKTDSIPFELFQNADDAYEQLGDSSPGSAPSFVLVRRDKSLVFLHFGRRINQNPVVDDLWKMSVLSLSNKGPAAGLNPVAVTGKFGLGFKSVFLACDRPKLLSGRLAFEFVGGIYPRRLIGDQRRSLDEFRRGAANNDSQATIIELNLREGVDAEHVISRFERLAHLLVVFGRKVRRCVCGDGGNETSWQPIDVPKIVGCSTGSITSVAPRENENATRQVLLFKSDEGSLLFALGNRGFESFDSDVPTIWVTAPTEEELQLGFLVNGPFALDVGRAQLARDPTQNYHEARALGQRFGKQLGDFFVLLNASPQRNEVRDTLRFAKGVKPYDIWNSLWDRLVSAVSERTSNDQPADQLIRAILWTSSDCGAAHFYSKFEAIPVRLPGKPFAEELVRLAEVKFAIRGVLADSERRPEFDGYALTCVRAWPAFRDRIGGGKLISHEYVVAPLKKLCPDLVEKIAVVALPDILRWEFSHQMIDTVKAERLGELLTLEFLDQISDPAEANRIREILDTAEFLGSDDHYHPARELLIGQTPFADGGWSSDECLRTGFAPSSRVVSDKYGQLGLRFFLACRKKLTATSQEMAGWVRAAQSHVTRKAALVYLADGEAGRMVQSELKRQGVEGTWLADLATLPCFTELSMPQKHRLAELLERQMAAELMQQTLAGVRAPAPLNPRTVLRAIHDWWATEGPQATREYETSVYPNGGLHFLNHETDEHAQQRRKDWVTLFLLGLTHTMGRTVAEQHRNFLRRCEEDGWLEMIASSERQPGNWMARIDRFLDQQLDDSRFLQWMKQFVGIYQVSRHLDDYIELFLSAQRFQRPFALTQLTNSRASADQQGGGIDAPALSRVLGMGQCFVLRELFRHRVISNAHVHPHCFVPVARVRRMLIDLGCEDLLANQRPWEWSRPIYAFLQRHLGDHATFDGAFDIPLQVVADNSELQMRFFAAPIKTDDEESALWFDDDNPLQSEDT